jgi:hypothetical protein
VIPSVRFTIRERVSVSGRIPCLMLSAKSQLTFHVLGRDSIYIIKYGYVVMNWRSTIAHGIRTSYDPYHEWALAMNATQPPDFAPRIAVFLYVGSEFLLKPPTGLYSHSREELEPACQWQLAVER